MIASTKNDGRAGVGPAERARKPVQRMMGATPSRSIYLDS